MPKYVTIFKRKFVFLSFISLPQSAVRFCFADSQQESRPSHKFSTNIMSLVTADLQKQVEVQRTRKILGWIKTSLKGSNSEISVAVPSRAQSQNSPTFFSLTFLIIRLSVSETNYHQNSFSAGHLEAGFSWFLCAYKQMLRWFPRFQVATTVIPRLTSDLANEFFG